MRSPLWSSFGRMSYGVVVKLRFLLWHHFTVASGVIPAEKAVFCTGIWMWANTLIQIPWWTSHRPNLSLPGCSLAITCPLLGLTLTQLAIWSSDTTKDKRRQLWSTQLAWTTLLQLCPYPYCWLIMINPCWGTIGCWTPKLVVSYWEWWCMAGGTTIYGNTRVA